MVRFIHYTAQEYFDRNPIVAPLSVQQTITKTCVAYLSLEYALKGPCSNDNEMRKRFESKPFLRYAACNWGIHARGQPELACRETIMLFTIDEEAKASAIQAAHVSIEDLGRGFERSQDYHRKVPGLVYAASFGLNKIVKYFLLRDESIETTDQEGTTALQSAAAGGHTDTVEVLLAAGADIDRKNNRRATALTIAIVNGHELTAKTLINKGASLQAKSSSLDRSPLCVAVHYGRIPIVNLLFEKGVTVEDARDILNAAVRSQSVKLVETILGQLSNDQRQSAIKTSLIDCLSSGNNKSRAICDLLLLRGADTNLCNVARESQLHLAVRQDLCYIAESLLDHGMDPDIKTPDGSTPLHWATIRGNLPLVELLLKRGAGIDAQNCARETVLHTCLQYNSHSEIISFLLRWGISLNEMDSQGRTSLHLAAQRGLSKAVMSMVEKGADIHAKDCQGWMPLHHAAANGHEHILDLLADDHAHFQQPSHRSLLESARLRAAIALRNTSIVDVLLRNSDLDINVSDYEGRTALHLAAASGQKNIVTALLDRGASVMVRMVDPTYVNQHMFKHREAGDTYDIGGSHHYM